MSIAEFHAHLEDYLEEPWFDTRHVVFLLAELCAMFVNANFDTKGKRFTSDDFVPRLKKNDGKVEEVKAGFVEVMKFMEDL